jgi:hypothetical protein
MIKIKILVANLLILLFMVEASASPDLGAGRHVARFINDTNFIAGAQIDESPNLWYYNGAWINMSTNLKNFTVARYFSGYKSDGVNSYWIIVGGTISGTGGHAINKWYPANNTFIDINQSGVCTNKSITLARYGNTSTADYWLIGCAGDYFDPPELWKYDGNNFTNMSANLTFGGGVTKAIWNGTKWFITGNRGWIFSWDGVSTWDDLTSGWNYGSIPALHDIDGLRWNGTIWLVGGVQGQLMTYNGRWENVTTTTNGSWFGIDWSPSLKYWLIGSEGTGTSVPALLQKYDGNTRTNISGWNINWSVYDIDWTGTKFLIAYTDVANGSQAKIASYDGTNLLQWGATTTTRAKKYRPHVWSSYEFVLVHCYVHPVPNMRKTYNILFLFR